MFWRAQCPFAYTGHIESSDPDTTGRPLKITGVGATSELITRPRRTRSRFWHDRRAWPASWTCFRGFDPRPCHVALRVPTLTLAGIPWAPLGNLAIWQKKITHYNYSTLEQLWGSTSLVLRVGMKIAHATLMPLFVQALKSILWLDRRLVCVKLYRMLLLPSTTLLLPML